MALRSRLFRFYGPSSQRFVFDDCTLRYSTPASFNDPFEFRPKVRLVETPEILQTLRASHDKPDMDIDLLLAGLVFFHSSNGTGLTPLESEAQEHLQRVFSQLYGVFCMSRSINNGLMWGHYAQNHTGFAIGLDHEHPYFRLSKMPLVDVSYLEQRPEIGPLTDLSPITVERLLLHAATLKSSCWSYEAEVRHLTPLLDCTHAGAGIYLKTFPRDLITEVFLGHRMPKKQKDDLIAYCGTHGIPCFWAHPSSHTFDVEFRRLDP